MVIPGTVLGIDTKDGTGWGQGQGTGMGRGKNNIWGGKMGRGGGETGYWVLIWRPKQKWILCSNT